MSCRCTDGDPAATAVPARWPRRIAALAQWALPITTLALIPKCPACIAAYVLLLTGAGLSFPVATAMRWTLVALSIAALACLLLRTARRALASRPHASTGDGADPRGAPRGPGRGPG